MTSNFNAAALAGIEPALQRVVDSGDLSGAVTMVWRRGEVVRVDAVGRRDIERDLPMTRDTIFRIASMTKPVASVALLMLVEAGLVSLDDPIVRWAPEFADMRVLRDPTGPLDHTDPAPRAITIEDLLTHRAGLAYNFTSRGPLAKAYETTLGSPLYPPMDEDAWMAAVAGLPLAYPPGDRFHYSHATDVLGVLVGRISGVPFRDFLMQRIFEPLGMVDTDFWAPPERRDRAAKVYQFSSTAQALKPVVFSVEDRLPPMCGGGAGLLSTADDYLAFARMLMNRGELNGARLLKPETVDLMTANRLTDRQREIPFLDLPFWNGRGFGLGVEVTMDAEKQSWAGPSTKGAFGWPGAFGTWWRADPAEDLIMLYLIQNAVPLSADSASQAATGQRLGGMMAQAMFQSVTYGALAR